MHVLDSQSFLITKVLALALQCVVTAVLEPWGPNYQAEIISTIPSGYFSFVLVW